MNTSANYFLTWTEAEKFIGGKNSPRGHNSLHCLFLRSDVDRADSRIGIDYAEREWQSEREQLFSVYRTNVAKSVGYLNDCLSIEKGMRYSFDKCAFLLPFSHEYSVYGVTFGMRFFSEMNIGPAQRALLIQENFEPSMMAPELDSFINGLPLGRQRLLASIELEVEYFLRKTVVPFLSSLNGAVDEELVRQLLQEPRDSSIVDTKAALAALLRRIDSFPVRYSTLVTEKTAREALQFEHYEANFHVTRSMTREVHLHIGPTNSGKTYAAMQRMLSARSGVYCAPLRLMALECYDNLKDAGVPASLVTGETISIDPAANHVACTIEMANTERPVDVAIVDEVQMILDEQRGWAWTQALVGLPAKELHLCGSPEIEQIVHNIFQRTNEEVIVHRYERLCPLEPLTKTVVPSDLRPGDAVIAFSRREVLELAEEIQARGVPVSVIYGALGPEVRRSEAEKFRNGDTQILFATDAIGMGLNLPIKRVLLSALHKYDGTSERRLTPAELRQICGRAGRYKGGAMSEIGYFGTFSKTEQNNSRTVLETLTKLVSTEPVAPASFKPYVGPHIESVQKFYNMTVPSSLYTSLSALRGEYAKHNFYRSAITYEMLSKAQVVDAVAANLSLRDKLIYLYAPSSSRASSGQNDFIEFIRGHSLVGSVPYSGIPYDDGWDDEKLDFKDDWETFFVDPSTHHEGVLSRAILYQWLSLRLPTVYFNADLAERDYLASTKALQSILSDGNQRALRKIESRAKKKAKRERKRLEKQALQAATSDEAYNGDELQTLKM